MRRRKKLYARNTRHVEVGDIGDRTCKRNQNRLSQCLHLLSALWGMYANSSAFVDRGVSNDSSVGTGVASRFS